MQALMWLMAGLGVKSRDSKRTAQTERDVVSLRSLLSHCAYLFFEGHFYTAHYLLLSRTSSFARIAILSARREGLTNRTDTLRRLRDREKEFLSILVRNVSFYSVGALWWRCADDQEHDWALLKLVTRPKDKHRDSTYEETYTRTYLHRDRQSQRHRHRQRYFFYRSFRRTAVLMVCAGAQTGIYAAWNGLFSQILEPTGWSSTSVRKRQ